MKYSLFFASLVLFASQSFAEISVSVSSHWGSRHSNRDHRGGWYSPHRQPRYLYPARRAYWHAPYVNYRPVIVHEQVVVREPEPIIQAEGTLFDFRERVARQRALLKNQYERGFLSRNAYDRHSLSLEELEKEERRSSFDHYGKLPDSALNNLFQQLKQVEIDIDQTLSVS